MTSKSKTAVENGRGLRVFLRCWIGIVSAWLLLPTLVVVPMSFSSSSTFKFPPPGWSLQWYERFFSSSEWLNALWTSIQVALISAVLALVLGVLAAIGFARWRGRGRSVVQGVIMAPMIIPLVVVGVSVYSVFLGWDLVGGLLGFVIAHTILGVPFVFVSVSTSLQNYDTRLDSAAATLGAGRWVTFRTVTLPIIMPGVASGLLFALVTSFDEVVVALFLQSPEFVTLPIMMYNAVALDIDPTVAAASTLIVFVTSVIILSPEIKKIWNKQ